MTTFTTPFSTTVYGKQLATALGAPCSFANILAYQTQMFQEAGLTDNAACQLVFNSLNNGTAIIRTDEQANAYLAAYGDMHRLKLDSAYKALFRLPSDLTDAMEVIDWGCGQGMASGLLLDYVRRERLALDIRRVTLIEPSELAIGRASDHLKLMPEYPKLVVRQVNGSADRLTPAQLVTDPKKVKIHLFSNLLDMQTVDYQAIARLIRQTQSGLNLFVCVSPLLGYSDKDVRIEAFGHEFPARQRLSDRRTSINGTVFGVRVMRPIPYRVTRNESIFSVQL